MEQESPQQFVERVLRMRDILAPRFPDIDPGDLLLIVQVLLMGRPKRFFLRAIAGGGHAP